MIDFDAIPDLDAPIEPWQPKAGDRVRVTAAIAECDVPFERVDPYTHSIRFDDNQGHSVLEIGAVGTVVPNYEDAFYAHIYRVKFDVPLDVKSPFGCMLDCGYAACELEPVDKEAR